MRLCLSSNCRIICAAIIVALVMPHSIFSSWAQTPVASPKSDAMAVTPLLFVVHFTTGPAWDHAQAAHAQPGMKEHSANLARLRTEGKLVTGARYKDSQADKGMIILKAANRAEVEAELANDPMVAEKIFVADIAEFRPFYDGFVARAGTAAAMDPIKSLAQFGWLAGCWQGQNGNVSFREHWMPEAGGMMIAMARTLRAMKVVGFESIRLELDADGTPVLIPKPSGQSAARFRLASASADKFIFENKQHDFPQRVIYQKLTGGQLLARIEGERDGKLRAVDFPMSRSSCE